MMLPFLRIGPVLTQMSGLALLAGLWVAMTLIERESLRLKLNAGAILNMVFYGLAGGIIGARLIYAVQLPSIYLASPLDLLSFSASTLDPIAGLIIGVVIAFLFGRRQNLPLRPTLDALAPGLAVFLIALGVANILSGNSYGAPSQLPWAVYLWGEYQQPTQVYETLAAVITFVIWKRTSTGSRSPGTGFLQVVALSAGARIFLEAFHGASALLPGGFRAAQVIGLIILALAIYLARQWGKPELASSEQEPTAPS